jgi:hypothetical protein
MHINDLLKDEEYKTYLSKNHLKVLNRVAFDSLEIGKKYLRGYIQLEGYTNDIIEILEKGNISYFYDNIRQKNVSVCYYSFFVHHSAKSLDQYEVSTNIYDHEELYLLNS